MRLFISVWLLLIRLQGIGKLSLVAQSAASVVQSGTKELTSKVYHFQLMIHFDN